MSARSMMLLPAAALGVTAATAGGIPPEAGVIDPPAAVGAMAPNVVVVADQAILTWLEPVAIGRGDGATFRLRLARFDGDRWSAPVTIVQRDDLFVNWADVPSVAAGANGVLVAHWLQRSGDGPYAYDVMLSRSTDGGGEWTPLGPAHDDGTQTEHGFVSLVPDGEGVRAFWLDGREMAGGDDDAGHGGGEMMLRTALVTDRVGESVRLDARVCECCGTAAATIAGGSFIVYRDRGPEEVRDISIVRRAGRHWSKPRPVATDGWEIAGCPVNGPAADGSEMDLVVAWFTGAGGRDQVFASFSTDGGATFGPSRPVDADQSLGRVDVVQVAPGEAVVSWLDAGLSEGVIALRRVASDGRTGRPLDVAPAGLSRRTGFPRLAGIGGRLLVVWTQDTEPTRLRAAVIDLADVPALEPVVPSP